MINIIKTTLPISMREFEVTSFAQSLVEAGAACVQQHEISSTYEWEGKIQHEKEWSISVKVSSTNIDSIIQVIKHLHPYEVPQILIQSVEANSNYEDWVNSS
ncbi:MAG: divalent-cation tolerance protein CutA [Candidatus Poseidoniaceae archaeon]|jgi:periplasmic divalent cation tolerance protein